MTGISSMNIGRSLASKVAAAADVFMQSGSEVMALQEVDVNAASAVSTVAAFRAHGLRLLLGSFDGTFHRTALLSRVQGRQVSLPGVAHQARYTAAIFEFAGSAGWMKVLVACTYGHASDPVEAADHAFDLAAALAASGHSWVMVGDFNVGMEEDPMCRRCSDLFAGRPLDETFIGEVALPMTSPNRLRRIDYGWASFDLPATSVCCFETVADHLGVTYRFDFTVPLSPVGPHRLKLRSDGPVSEGQWRSVWGPVDAQFQVAVQSDSSKAWEILSRAAEKALAVDDSSSPPPPDVVARHALWRPRIPRQVHKASNPRESIILARLRRLQRRVSHLARTPHDACLRRNIQHDLMQMGRSYPALREFIGFEASACSVVDELVRAREAEEKEISIQSWRARLDGSLHHQRDWIRRRAALEREVQRPCSHPAALQPRVALHPARVIEQATSEWLPRWTCQDQIDMAAVHEVLQSVPPVTQHSVDFDFTGQQLHGVAKKMVGKSPGPDGWTVEQWLLLPAGFWSALASIWRRIVETGDVPDAWRCARVALLPKDSGGFRPLSLLAIGWRIGARALLSQLNGWAEAFLDHRLLGGVRGRCVKDALTQILTAANDGEVVIAQDLAKFFDHVNMEHLQAALSRLGAPLPLCRLVHSFYATHLRIFSHAGYLGKDWHLVSRGLCQGCPLSPLLAAVVMCGWASHVASSGASALAFVDDRYFYSRDSAVLRHAKRLSDEYDQAFCFSCEDDKCQIATAEGDRIGPILASMWGYRLSPSLKVLGIIVDFNNEGRATLAKFSVFSARRCLRLIAIAAKTLAHRSFLIQQLLSPLYTWAGAFASISEHEAEELRADTLYTGNKGCCAEAAKPILLELMGWSKDPVFMRKWCVFKDLLRIMGNVRPWQESAPISVSCRLWHHVLPVAKQVLSELSWWTEDNGRSFCRRDSSNLFRKFRVGIDSPRILMEWLSDWHRRKALQACGRVAVSLHRQGQGLAQGHALPGVAPHALCIFEGHRQAYAHGDFVTKQIALASGCSGWHRCTKYKLPMPCTCLCGDVEPSRPHIVWTCPSRTVLRDPNLIPSNRAEERLFAKTVPEWPPPPAVLDEPGFIEDLAAGIQRALQTSEDILVATDGSEVLSVAASSIVVSGEAHAIGVSGEDQTSYKSEAWALVLLFKALLHCSATGRVTVASDCTSALALLRGRGQLRALAHFFGAADAQLRARGLLVTPWWIPSHGKRLPRDWLPPGWSALQLRAANDIADRAARALASARLAGSQREWCALQRREAARWESQAIAMAVAIAKHFDLHG